MLARRAGESTGDRSAYQEGGGHQGWRGGQEEEDLSRPSMLGSERSTRRVV